MWLTVAAGAGKGARGGRTRDAAPFPGLRVWVVGQGRTRSGMPAARSASGHEPKDRVALVEEGQWRPTPRQAPRQAASLCGG